MTKCDFCDKPMIGACSHQCAMYCEDHVKEAEEIERKMFDAMDDGSQDES